MIFYATPFPVHIIFPGAGSDPMLLADLFDRSIYRKTGIYTEPRIHADDRQLIASIGAKTTVAFNTTGGIPQVKHLIPIISDDIAFRHTPLMFIDTMMHLHSVTGENQHTTEDAPWIIDDQQMLNFQRAYLDHLMSINPNYFVLPFHVY